MTLQQEAYEMMKGMSDDNVRFIIEVIKRITPSENRFVDPPVIGKNDEKDACF